jgi:F-type H+-transporting ATPase subunit b
MNLILLAAEEPGAAPNVFNLSLGVSFWTFIIFIILVWVLAKFAFPPILGYAAAREQRIQDALDTAQRQREQTEQLLAQQREELDQAKQQAQLLIAEGKTAAERLRDDMLQRARVEQEELLERARGDIARERDVALESIRREAVEVAMAAASKLIGQRLNTAEDRRLVNEYLTSVASSGDGAAPGAGAS